MFMCQRDSFLTEYDTEVISCERITDPKTISSLSIDLKKLQLDENINNKVLSQIVLKDTILFPEGGGQPDDRGFINDAEVVRVIRNGTDAIHYVVEDSSRSEGKSLVEGVPNSDVEETTIGIHRHGCNKGDKVSIKLDWPRRFDHMQQHSGQHLITAVADSMFGFPTTSWWLGSEDSYIELDTKDIIDEQLNAIEEKVNKKIRECTPVSVEVVELDDPKLQSARGRNLPEDVKGQIRIVTMAGVESNVCCGTHVTNLSQLQVIKILNVIKKKGKCLLYFLSGNRVIDRFSQQFQREQKLMGILKSSPADFPVAAEKLNVALKNVRKTAQVLSKDLAALEAKKFLENENASSKFWSYHRDNVDLDFGTALLREIGQTKATVLLITLKVDGNSGHLMLVGGEEVIKKEDLTKLGENLCEVLDGKGSLRGNLYQAKVNKINGVNKAVKIAQEFVNQLAN